MGDIVEINYLGQLLNCSILALFGAWIVWAHDRKVLSRCTRETLQYKMFALRDRAIYLVAKGECSEENEDWKEMYWYINESAKAVNVDKIRSPSTAFSFVRHVINRIPDPPERKSQDFDSLPKPIRRLWLDFCSTVVEIGWSSRMFRWAFSLAISWQIAKIVATIAPLLKKILPEIARPFISKTIRRATNIFKKVDLWIDASNRWGVDKNPVIHNR